MSYFNEMNKLLYLTNHYPEINVYRGHELFFCYFVIITLSWTL